jgi:murein DD-endopeptidase MepM/ murein hydrolase activator NlpD
MPYSSPKANTKGSVPIDVIVMTLFMILLIVVLTAMALSGNRREQVVLLRDLDLISVSGLQKLAASSLATSWNVIGTQVALDVLQERFGLGHYWFNGTGEAAISSQLANQKLQEGISSAALPDSFSVRLKEGRVREIERVIGLDTAARSLAATQTGVEGKVNQTLRIDGQRPVQADASFIVNISVPIRLLAIAQAAASAVSSSKALSSESFAYGSEDRQYNVLGRINARLAAGLAAASQISPSSFLLSEALESADQSSLQASYDNSVRISDGRRRAASGRINCSAVADAAERDRRELLYNRYAGAIESANPDSLLPYADNPRALIAAVVDASSGWNPGTGLMDLQGSKEPHRNAAAGVEALRLSFAQALGSGATGNGLLALGLINYTGSQEAADAYLSKYSDWKQCSYSADSGDIVSAKYVLARPVDYITTEPELIFFPELDFIELPPTLATYYGNPTGHEGAPSEGFSHAIEVLVAPDEGVKAAADGVIFNALLFSQYGFGTSAIAIQHRDRNNQPYFTVYGGVIPSRQQGVQVKAGEAIATANATGLLRFGVFDGQRNSVNPCLYLGCMSLGHVLSASPNAILPETGFEIYGPLDFASLLNSRAQNSGLDIRLGEDFCSLWNKPERGLRSEAYRFYAIEGGPFEVFPAYEGTVERVSTSDEENCGESIFVRTGDFVTVYGRVKANIGITSGTRVSPSLSIARVAPTTTCPNPHLRVSFAPVTFTIRDPQNPVLSRTNACGTSSDCRFTEIASGPFTCNTAAGKCDTLPIVAGVSQFDPIVPPHICAALEWPSLFVPKPEALFWRERPGRSTFERTGAELSFRTADSLKVLDCANPANEGRHDLIDEKELLCAGGKAYACGLEISGAINIREGEGVDLDGDGLNDYTCATNYIRSPPDFLRSAPPAQTYYQDTFLSRFCRTDGGDDKEDWFCCFQLVASLGGNNRNFRCTAWDTQTFRDTGRLACTIPAADPCPATGPIPGNQ